MAKDILSVVKSKIKGKNIRIIYTEHNDKRILQGAYEIYKKKLGQPIIVGNIKEIEKNLKALSIPNIFLLHDPSDSPLHEDFSKELYQIRKDKGLSISQAHKLMLESNYFGTMLLHKGYGDCLISGASYTTAETLRPAIQIIKTQPGVTLASSFFLMILKNKTLVFADCSFIPNPDAKQLCEIAVQTVASTKKFGITPKVAFLSYSTKGSSSGPSVDIVRQATLLAKKRLPNIIIDGELQLDTAIVPLVAKIKTSSSPIKGDANILIFPNLDSGNIGYKLVERLAGAKALGPISQGFNKPLDVLSRGCSLSDVIDVSSITILMALEHKNKNSINHKPK